MAYQIRFTDQINNQALTVDDNTTNDVTDLNFPGRNTTGYGQAIGENFLHLLENFVNTSEPSRPTKGQLWYDTNANIKQLKIRNKTMPVSNNLNYSFQITMFIATSFLYFCSKKHLCNRANSFSY